MPRFIPEEKISEISGVADIVEIISESVVLKKAGKDYSGLCPFHSEKTPSFSVSPAKQVFHCFGCGAGGNVYSFLMKKEDISFLEAVKRIAARYGIELPQKEMTDEQRQHLRLREELFSVNEAAMEFFRRSLEDPRGTFAREYLRKRGITAEVQEIFKIGFAPAGWENLINEFRQKRIPAALAEQAGLIIPRKQGGGYYDRFRNRIIFPIIDGRGAVSGFGGRVMDDGMPKYLNSPESPIYHKSRSLYGLHHTRLKCREADAVFLVEGYFDLIAMARHGIENGAATLGTSLTRDHVRLLKRCAAQAFLVYDADPAGLRAAVRSIDIFESEGMAVRVMVLPEGHDPDTYLFENGADAFLRIAENALSAFDFLMEEKIRQHGLSIEGKVQVVSELASYIESVRDPVKRSLYVQALGERIGVAEAHIHEKIGPLPKNNGQRSGFHGDDPYDEAPQLWPDDLSPGDLPPDDYMMADLEPDLGPDFGYNAPSAVGKAAQQRSGDRLERRMIEMMFQCPDMASEVARRGIVACFRDHRIKAVGEMLLSRPGSSLSEIADQMADEESRGLITALAAQENGWRPDDCYRLMEQFLARRRPVDKDLQEKIRAAEAGDDALLFQLLEEKKLRALSAFKPEVFKPEGNG